MLLTDTIWLVILAVVPIIIYSAIVYFSIPPRFVGKKRSRRYLISGLFAPCLISLYYFLFPNLSSEPASYSFLTLFIFCIIQIGCLEELSKFIMFKWVSYERPSEKNDLPIAIIFYSMMTSVGFAITENISYLINWKYKLLSAPYMNEQILTSALSSMTVSRSLYAVVAHMVCGIIMGYFLAKAHLLKIQFANLNSKLITIKKIFYIICGIGCASLYHGIYDLNLHLPDNQWVFYFHALNIIFGLVLSKFMVKEMICQSEQLVNKSREKNIN